MDIAHDRNDIGPVIDAIVREIAPSLVEIRRDIHAHPEIGFEVERTAGVVAAELTRLGIACKTGVGRTGVVADIQGSAPGPRLVIRADMDALPMQETTGLPYASTIPGRMHACGHDLHTATLIGVGAVLSQLSGKLSGSIRLVFQPAEETIDSGAAAMIADGALEGVDMALGFHNEPSVPAGKIAYIRGASFASADSFQIVVEGRSGHAAQPHEAVDPIVAAGHLLTQLQTIVSRELNPIRSAVVTVGRIEGGDAYNIIPNRCTMAGTVRTRSPEARDAIEAAMKRICAGVSLVHRVDCKVDYRRNLPPVMSADGLLDLTVEAVRQQGGDVIEVEGGFGAEDFAFFSERVPSSHIRIGSGQPGREDRVHNSNYQPDEGSIAAGVRALSRTAFELLGNPRASERHRPQ
ncbi:amidohydrolase [Bosea sp. F3-2]|uniref:M20 metallopeptidase family protein n=1 Tax=Bosea sp. F3-2 TaxID=2599640 RepID=UPI0011EE0075|nr:M20 family metallopeptidase [Bosea sp. F3-2]QEL22261.1 amidohydrolase [Bosea sp. F3-2]